MWVSWRWILWNVFLAVIPVVAAWLLAQGVETWTLQRKRVPLLAWLPLALIWLAFLPNTCYLLTEWRHFLFDPVPVAVRQEATANRSLMLLVAEQGLFYLLYSAIGVVCFALAIRPIAQMLRRAKVRLLPWGSLFFFLTSLGVYMGLIVRLNSWDIMTRPDFVLSVAVRALTSPLLLKTIMGFAFILWALYVIVDIWVEGVAWRLAQARDRNAKRRKLS